MTLQPSKLQNFIEAHVAQAQPLRKATSEAYWNFTITSRPEHQQEYQRLETQIRKLYADRSAYARLKELMAAEPPTHPLLGRQAEVLANHFLAQQIDASLIEQIVTLETQIEAQFNSFRATLNGQPVPDNQLRDLLRNSNDGPQCQAAWEACKQIGARVAEQVRQVVQLRNQAAHQVGFTNFYTMRLALDELDEGDLFELWDKLDKLTAPLYADYKTRLESHLSKRFGLPASELYPWHYGDPFFQEAPPSDLDMDPYFAGQNLLTHSKNFNTAIGLDINDIIARSDLYEREGKQQHAYCTNIDRAGDVRVLCNIQPTEYWMNTLLHEFGHAVYDKYLDSELPWLLRCPAHTSTTEAIAVMMGSLTKNPHWLIRYIGLPADEAHALGQKLQEQARAELLIFTRWVMVMSHFERELYRSPEQDLNRLWWNMVEQYQMLRPPAARPDGDWAAKIHIATVPVYYHNYLLGHLMAAQLHTAINQQLGSPQSFVGSPEVGRWLIERVFRPGQRWNWNGLLEHATGAQLRADTFATVLQA